MATKWTQTRVTEVEALKAIAHPIRVQLLGSLRSDGPATASELGRRFDESSGSTSYHLRQLAKHGFVVEDADQPSKRERRWRAAAQLTHWQDDDFADDPAGHEASDALSELQLGYAVRNNRRWRAERTDWSRAWRRAGGASDVMIRLTPTAAKRLISDMDALLARYDDECSADPRAEQVGVFYQLTPGRTERGEKPSS